MAHLIRTISGTNRDPVYGLWRNCEDCAETAPAETMALLSVLEITEQIPGMSLAEFWDAFVGAAEIGE